MAFINVCININYWSKFKITGDDFEISVNVVDILNILISFDFRYAEHLIQFVIRTFVFEYILCNIFGCDDIKCN